MLEDDKEESAAFVLDGLVVQISAEMEEDMVL